MLEVTAALPESKEPVACPHFGRCGGCDYLDTPYDEELVRKAEKFRKQMARELDLGQTKILPILPAARPLFGRSSIKVPFGPASAALHAGFYQRGTQRIVNLQACVVQDPRLTEIVLATRAEARRLSIPPYDSRRDRGQMRALVARIGAGTEEILAGLVVRRGRTPKIRQLAEFLFERFSAIGLGGVVENVNKRRDSAVMGDVTRTLVGNGRLAEESRELRSITTLSSFSQTNHEQAEVLFDEVLRTLGDVEGLRIVDLFSGSGPIAMRLALAGARVTAIERNSDAVRQGQATAKHAGLSDRVRFLTSDAGRGLQRLDAEGIDAVVVDPARRGLAPNLLATLGRSMFPRLIYVSCNPITLLNDISVLSGSFKLRSLRPVDLFPRVDHLEVVASLERRAPDDPGPTRRPRPRHAHGPAVES